MKKLSYVLGVVALCLQGSCLLFSYDRNGSAAPVNPAIASEQRIFKAHALPLKDVRLTGGPLKHSEDLDADYLLKLEPDRMLAYLRQRAGLQTAAQPYGGWDGAGRQLTGHIAGHYLSGVSIMYAATGDERFKQRADYVVAQLKEIQDKQGDGYIGALLDNQNVDGKTRFEDLSKGVIRSGGFDLNGLWSPWYVEHKIFAGLRDAYRYTGNRTALDVEIKFAAWAEKTVAPLDDAQIQKMLATEFGGMNEVTADLYADTGDKRWLALSDKFEHKVIIDPLSKDQDIMGGKHANTLVPKMIGELSRYVYTGDETDGNAAKYFWDETAAHHTFATGGQGRNEYYGQPGKLSSMVDGRTAENCNVYNMLKYARELFCVNPDVKYADYEERALYNHILASQDPDDGRTCYMVNVGRGVQHEWQDMYRSFTCCVGSSMESYALNGDGIYFEAPGKLWVNLYAPTHAQWEEEGVTLEMQTDLPEGNSATLKVTPKAPNQFAIELRRPYWAVDGFTVRVNGKLVKDLPPADSYVEINRKWKTGDTVELSLPKTLREEPLPDNPNRMAIEWGGLVLAGDLGEEIQFRRNAQNSGEAPQPPAPAPVLVPASLTADKWLAADAGKIGEFHTVGAGLNQPIEFVPFYRIARRRYAVYWDVYTPDEWKRIADAHSAEQEQQRKLEAATVGFAQPGQMQAERDFNEQGENSTPTQTPGHFGRRAFKTEANASQGTWFSFDVPVDSSHPMNLVVTYSNDARTNCTFQVLVDGQNVGEKPCERRTPDQDARYFDVAYSLPVELIQGKQKVTVRFDAGSGMEISGVYGIRTVRADALR